MAELSNPDALVAMDDDQAGSSLPRSEGREDAPDSQGFVTDFLGLRSSDEEDEESVQDEDGREVQMEDETAEEEEDEDAESVEDRRGTAIGALSAPANEVTVRAAASSVFSKSLQEPAPPVKTRLAVVEGNLLQRIPDVPRM